MRIHLDEDGKRSLSATAEDRSLKTWPDKDWRNIRGIAPVNARGEMSGFLRALLSSNMFLSTVLTTQEII